MKPEKDGSSMRQHLQSAASAGNKVAVACLDGGTPLPLEGEYIWEWFAQINRKRQNAGHGPLPISFAEIYAWSHLKRIQLQDWEVDLLDKLDELFRRVFSKEYSAPEWVLQLKGE